MSPKHVEAMYDVVIVGAGAAGLSAALGLAHSPNSPNAVPWARIPPCW